MGNRVLLSGGKVAAKKGVGGIAAKILSWTDEGSRCKITLPMVESDCQTAEGWVGASLSGPGPAVGQATSRDATNVGESK